MTDRTRQFAAALMLACMAPALAVDGSGTQPRRTETADSAPGKSALTPSELTRSRVWGLSQVEWHRYRQLMEGIRASVSPASISPVEVLGIHARDAGERRRYAELWARAMHEDVERILTFQRAYDEAVRRLYPDEPLIDVTRLPEADGHSGMLGPDERVLFFTRENCPACDDLLERVLARINALAGVDIYIAGLEDGDDQAVRDWAMRRGIDPAQVYARRITLNHEAGALQRLTRGRGTIPYMLRRKGDDLSVFRAPELR